MNAEELRVKDKKFDLLMTFFEWADETNQHEATEWKICSTIKGGSCDCKIQEFVEAIGKSYDKVFGKDRNQVVIKQEMYTHMQELPRESIEGWIRE